MAVDSGLRSQHKHPPSFPDSSSSAQPAICHLRSRRWVLRILRRRMICGWPRRFQAGRISRDVTFAAVFLTAAWNTSCHAGRGRSRVKGSRGWGETGTGVPGRAPTGSRRGRCGRRVRRARPSRREREVLVASTAGKMPTGTRRAPAAGTGRPRASEERSACPSPLTIATFEGRETVAACAAPGARGGGGCAARERCGEVPGGPGGPGPLPKRSRGGGVEGAKNSTHCSAHASGDESAVAPSNPRFSIFDQEDCVTPLLPLVRKREREGAQACALARRLQGDCTSASASARAHLCPGACARRRRARTSAGVRID